MYVSITRIVGAGAPATYPVRPAQTIDAAHLALQAGGAAAVRLLGE